MKRLSFVDALFLYMETPETPMHVASVTIFKPETPQDDLFARFREHVAARLDLLPSYRRRLEPTPLGIDQPAWVIEDKVDLDYHIRHEALPKPGGMEELRALIAQLHAAPLDRSRPLWEYHFIEGLESGAFAVYVKVHHSTMDGLAGMATLGVTFDFASGAEHEALPQRIVPPDAEPNDFIELTSTALGDFIRQGWRAVTGLPGMARALAKAAPHFGRDARFLLRYVREMPRTPFNTAISGHRVYATSSLPLADVKALARSRGVTINDVVLALCSGALRRYLAGRGALPEKALTAGMPVSIRPLGNAQLNNQVFFTLSRLPTDVAEPLPRLAAAKIAGQEAKNLFSDMRDLVTMDVSILGIPLVVTGLVETLDGGAGGELSIAVFQPRRLERAGAEADHVLCRSAGHALLPGFDSLSRLRAQHHRAELSRPARLRPNRLQRDRARRAAHRRLRRRRLRGDAQGRLGSEPPGGNRNDRGGAGCGSARRAYADHARRSEGRTTGAKGRKEERADAAGRRARRGDRGPAPQARRRPVPRSGQDARREAEGDHEKQARRIEAGRREAGAARQIAGCCETEPGARDRKTAPIRQGRKRAAPPQTEP